MHQPPVNLTSIRCYSNALPGKTSPSEITSKIRNNKTNLKIRKIKTEHSINKNIGTSLFRIKIHNSDIYLKFERYFFNARDGRASSRRYGAHYVNVSTIGTCAGRSKVAFTTQAFFLDIIN